MRSRRDHAASSVQEGPHTSAETPSGVVLVPEWQSTRRRSTSADLARALAAVLLFALGGVGLAAAPLRPHSPFWWYGASTLVVAGICLVAYRPRMRRLPRATSDPIQPASDPAPERDANVLVPMLGALLVYKYRFIKEWQLDKALELQRKQRKQRQRLGDVLLEMGVVTRSQLRMALDYQDAYLREKRAKVGRRSAARGHAHASPQPTDAPSQSTEPLQSPLVEDAELADLLTE